jgi:site-specific DNA recombinase
LRSYAKIKDWHIYGIYADEGISAKDIDGRPEIQRLIADVVSGKVKNVLVYKIDRLTRSTKNLIELIDLFNHHDCAFNSLNEAIDTASATGRMFLKIVGIFAEFERENLAERVRLGFERKAKEGDSSSAFASSYGYHREKGQKIQAIVEHEAEIVRRVFSMYLHGDYNFTQIEKVLNAENIPSKHGKLWGASSVKCILTNPNYIGKVRYSCHDEARYFESDGKHEAIIDAATFYEVQEKIERTKPISKTKLPASGVYFCGILRCAVCGGKLTTKWHYSKDGKKTPERPAYRCWNTLSKYKTCSQKAEISHIKIEAAFEAYIANIENFTELDAVDINAASEAPDHSKEIVSISGELEQIERKASEVLDLFMTSKVDFDTFQQMVKRGNDRKAQLEARLNILQNVEASIESRQSRQEIVANLRENWGQLNNEQRLQFLQKFVKKMVVRKETIPGERYGIAVIDEIVFNEF